jgi:S-sulfosulfanyl-L-cysteine sulfohydrolase
LLPGQDITREMMMDQMAITYPTSTLTDMTGATIKTILEDVAENLFHPDPYYQQGGDMVRVGGLDYTCTPAAGSGARISNMTLKGKPIEADKTYKVGGWAPVAEGVTGEPIWDVVETYMRSRKTIAAKQPLQPTIVGVAGNPGVST